MTDRPSKTGQQADDSAESECFDLSDDLMEFEQQHRIAKLAAKVAELRQAKQERGDLHRIRKSHAWRLFGVTVTWLLVVWVVVLGQGLGKLYVPRLGLMDFSLSDTVLVAFITSTTASVLGLYAIAAYWMFRNGRWRDQ